MEKVDKIYLLNFIDPLGGEETAGFSCNILGLHNTFDLTWKNVFPHPQSFLQNQSKK